MGFDSDLNFRAPLGPRKRQASARWNGSARHKAPVVLLLLAIFAVQAASARAADPAGLEFFENRIRPLLTEQCYPCHSAEAKALKADLRLDLRAGLLRGGKSGLPAIVAGDAAHSRLLSAVRRDDPDLAMPPKGKLTAQQVADLETWINLGAPDPRTGEITPPKPSAPHWSFMRVQNVTVPTMSSDWVRTPIDSFVLARLRQAGLHPSPAADKRTLIRRATYDLTGLPPTLAEVDAFLGDDSEDAFAKVVDRLLASPRYGERWGRYWLDLARYADTKGYVYSDREERFFVHAHPYRDWVINALNEDMPYDRFLLLQIAADQALSPEELAHDNRDLAAMGFLTLGRRFLGISHDIIDDRIDTVMRTTQGLTVACARCHDHKFDPIPTADYYSLYGVFANSTEKYVRLFDPARPENDATRRYDAEFAKRNGKLDQTFVQRRDEADLRSRARVTEYLVSVLNVEKLPVELFAMNLDPNDLNPLISRQWHTRIIRGKDGFDPIFTPWTTLAAIPAAEFSARGADAVRRLANDPNHPLNQRVTDALLKARLQSFEDVARTYGRIFDDVDHEWVAVSENPTITRLDEDAAEALRQVLYAADSPARVPPGPIAEVEMYFPEGVRVELSKLQAEIDRLNIQSDGAPAFALVLEDRPDPREVRILKRGNPATRGDAVPRQFLAVVAGADRTPFRHGSGRLEMARAIASADNPLTARVMVNRVWQHHFGQGLAATPSDVGTRCPQPGNQPLLDWLAQRFVSDGWSIKKLHRLIMLSAVYQQASDTEDPTVRATDPENQHLWKMQPARLDFESMRDSLLSASGELELAMGGRPVDLFTPPFAKRRSVYGLVDRQFLPGTFRVFDFANPDLHMPQRSMTTVPQQALYFLNSPFIADRCRAIAARADVQSASDDAAKIEALYRILYQRSPTPDEIALGRAFIGRPADKPEENAPAGFIGPPIARQPLDAWGRYVQVLLLSNEFMFVD